MRKLVGYNKLTGPEACQTLQQLYDASRLFVNYFQPSFKLKSKIRQGAHVQRKYHSPKTPCERLLARSDVSDQSKNFITRSIVSTRPCKISKANTSSATETYCSIQRKNKRFRDAIFIARCYRLHAKFINRLEGWRSSPYAQN